MAMHQVQLQAGLSMHHRIDDRSCTRGGPSWAAMPPASGPAQAHSSVESRAQLQAHTSLDKTSAGRTRPSAPHCCGTAFFGTV